MTTERDATRGALVKRLRDEAAAAEKCLGGQRFNDELAVVVSGILELAKLCSEAADALETIPSETRQSDLADIEDALWALHSYESNRDDAGRVYSEVDITKMVSAIRAFTPSATPFKSVPVWLWDDIVDFVNDHVDVRDGEDGVPQANSAMHLASRIETEVK